MLIGCMHEADTSYRMRSEAFCSSFCKKKKEKEEEGEWFERVTRRWDSIGREKVVVKSQEYDK